MKHILQDKKNAKIDYDDCLVCFHCCCFFSDARLILYNNLSFYIRHLHDILQIGWIHSFCPKECMAVVNDQDQFTPSYDTSCCTPLHWTNNSPWDNQTLPATNLGHFPVQQKLHKDLTWEC